MQDLNAAQIENSFGIPRRTIAPYLAGLKQKFYDEV
jgi:hypothetical protein